MKHRNKTINLLQVLSQQDTDRMLNRENMKKEMQKTAGTKNISAKIIFPKMHIPKDNQQLRHGLSWLYNGFLIYLPNLVMVVDPGIDFLYRLGISQTQISQINTIFISHGHLDHAGGANVISDWLIRSQQDTEIIAPKSVFDQKEISDFHSGASAHANGWKPPHFSTIIAETTPTQLAHGGYLLKPIPLHHGIECYGFSINYKDRLITYISDTGYAKKIKTTSGLFLVGNPKVEGTFESITEKFDDIYKAILQSHTLIVNIETLQYNKNSKTHLTVHDVIDMVDKSQVRQLIVAHVNPQAELDEAWGQTIAEYIQQQTGRKCFAPKVSGLTVKL